MKYFLSNHFKKQLKYLRKKHPHVQNDIFDEFDSIKLSSEISIGKSIYKIRINSSDLKKGKSGGFRCYIYFYEKSSIITPLCIYAKSEKESITNEELSHHFNAVNNELELFLMKYFVE